MRVAKSTTSNDGGMFEESVPPISPEEAKALIASGEAVVVDVRESDELAKTGKIAGALHVPLATLQSHEFDRGKAILLYCGIGERAGIGGQILQAMGYRNVFNLGGFRDWVKNGGATERA